MTLFVQYGCGLTAPEGWINFDVSPRLRVERLPLAGAAMRWVGRTVYPGSVRYGDIVRGLPLADGSVDGLFCSHVLEHIHRASVEVALSNSFRVLKRGGVFRLIVPDLRWRAERFIADSHSGLPSAADGFMRACFLGQEFPPRGAMSRLRNAFGNSDHRWMYDYPAVEKLLTKAGFSRVRRCRLGDADAAQFGLVEREDRFFDEGFPELAVEAIRA